MTCLGVHLKMHSGKYILHSSNKFIYGLKRYKKKEKKICDAIKQNESEVKKIWFLVFWHFLLGYCLDFDLVKIP